jgi:hypothetical protein
MRAAANSLRKGRYGNNHYNLTRSEYYRQLDQTSKSNGDLRMFMEYAVRGFAQDACAVIEMGGTGPIPERVEFRASKVPIRGFWSHYARLMEAKT